MHELDPYLEIINSVLLKSAIKINKWREKLRICLNTFENEGKKNKGWKRHIVTDTQGLLIRLNVHAADEYDSRSGFRVFECLKDCFKRLKDIYSDGGYRGELIEKVKDMLNFNIKITLRTDKATEFKPLQKWLVIERSFVRLDDFRRLSKDYERKVVCSENMIYLAFISLMLKCLKCFFNQLIIGIQK